MKRTFSFRDRGKYISVRLAEAVGFSLPADTVFTVWSSDGQLGQISQHKKQL
jgi:hypothetical protein